MKPITDFSEVPHGLYLCRMFHERIQKHVLHLSLKANDGPWCEQPSTPTYSEESTQAAHEDFWKWANANLPIYNYPKPIKSCL